MSAPAVNNEALRERAVRKEAERANAVQFANAVGIKRSAKQANLLSNVRTCRHRECAHQSNERFLTLPTFITIARTVGAVTVGLMGAQQRSLTLLLTALVIYWIGDIADGAVARMTNSETRIGATLDIMCDRISAAIFYIGFAWFDSTMMVAVGIYLIEFMVVDMYLSLAFLAWPVASPNYFHHINRRLWLWNWSKGGKAINSALFAVLMVWSRNALLASVIATVLLALKVMSLHWLLQLQMPVPQGCVVARIDDKRHSAA